MFQHACLGTCCFDCLIIKLYASVLQFCICPCSAQLSMFHKERCSRNTLIIIIIIIIITEQCQLSSLKKKERKWIHLDRFTILIIQTHFTVSCLKFVSFPFKRNSILDNTIKNNKVWCTFFYCCILPKTKFCTHSNFQILS